jgi:signal transduction histidine kinase
LLVDIVLVAGYAALIALVTSALRPFHTPEPFQYIVPTRMGMWVVSPGPLPVTTGTEYHADGWTRVLPALLTVLLLPLVRRRPLVVAACLGVAEVAIGSVHAPADARYSMFIAVDLVVLSIALYRPRRASLKAAGLVLAGVAGSIAGFPPGASSEMQNHLAVSWLLLAVAWLVGNSLRERRASATRQRADAAAQAVANERLRIARELHDMIAHSIGIIAIQAGMGNRVIATQPAEARKALQAIEETSRDTLSQLRRTLTALRHSGDAADTPTDPAPGLADLDKLVASTRHAGVLAIVETLGIPRPLPGEVDLAAYRIIQESVTNVVRHSGARTCHVTVEYGESEVAIAVSDDGYGVIGSGGTGFGLVGMRERVNLVHGEFNAGPRPGGGFLVRAKLPVPGGFGTSFGGGSASEPGVAADAIQKPPLSNTDSALDAAAEAIEATEAEAARDPGSADRRKPLPATAPALPESDPKPVTS